MTIRLNRDDFLRLFAEVDTYLMRNNPNGQVIKATICGGAAIAMINKDRYSVDVDIISDGIPPELREAVKMVGINNNLPYDWMNDGAKIWAPKKQKHMERVFAGKRLQLYIPDTECLLALKLASMRLEDIDDINFLMKETNVSSAEQALEIVANYIPSQRLTAQVQFRILDFFDTEKPI